MPNYPYDQLGTPLDIPNLDKMNGNWAKIAADIASVKSNVQTNLNVFTNDFNTRLFSQQSDYSSRFNNQYLDYTSKLYSQRKEYRDGFEAQKIRINNIVSEISDVAFNEVVSSATVNWKTPVADYGALTTTYPSAVNGDTAQTLDDNKTYRFDGTEWKFIQQFGSGPFTDVYKKLANQKYFVNVKEFGAIGDGIADDTNAFQAAFDFIESQQISYKEEDMSLYTGNSFELIIPKGIYNITSTILIKGSYLSIKGERPIFQTPSHTFPVFLAQGINGWQFDCDGVTFDRTGDAFKFESSNLEAGQTNFTNCWFIDVQGTAIDLNKQSQIATIKKCKFHKCDYVLKHENVDRLHFEDNWVSEKPRTISGDASIISKSFQLISKNNLWVPYPAGVGVTETAYVNAYMSFHSENDHYGGEEGSKPVVNVYGEGVQGTGYPKSISVINSPNMNNVDGYTIVRLFKLPNLIQVSHNVGLFDNTGLIKWAGSANQSGQISRVVKKQFMRIDIVGNVGERMNIDPAVPLIPDNLRIFLVNKIEHTHYRPTITTSRSGNLANANNFTIGTGVLKNTPIEKTYYIEMTMGENGSSMYRSRYVGYINFYTYYNGSKVVTRADLTPIYNVRGGSSSPGSPMNIAVYFIESGLNTIETSGSASANNELLLNVEVYGFLPTFIKFNVREMLEGSLL